MKNTLFTHIHTHICFICLIVGLWPTSYLISKLTRTKSTLHTRLLPTRSPLHTWPHALALLPAHLLQQLHPDAQPEMKPNHNTQ